MINYESYGINVEEYEVTSKMIRIVYFEIHNNIQFDSRNSMVILQKQNGAQIGNHHVDRKAASTIQKYF